VALQYGKEAPAWTSEIQWGNVVNVRDFEGKDWNERFEAAQKAVAAKGGGVVHFPAGVYEFQDDVVVRSGVVILGQRPGGVTDARDDEYRLGTRFVFPLYKPTSEGEGTPVDTAFKKICLAEPATDSNVGVVYVAIDRGHIHFAHGEDHRAGRNRLVMGNILTNTASYARDVPRKGARQHAWQRWTHRHRAAIHACSERNLLIANNRIPKSGQANFEMPDYVLARKADPNVHDLAFDPSRHRSTKVVVPKGIVFDYDNRPGIYANDAAIGSPGDGLPNGTPEKFPHGFRKGTVIRGNYIYSHGRCPIAFAGDGTIVEDNVIRIPPDLWRPTCRGFETSGPGSTNDNRAIQCRGYRWVVRNNDFQVHSNLTFDRKHHICDGEGIMHENHVNSKVFDSKVLSNTGNAYICIWRVEVDGLEVRGNRISKAKGSYIDVNAAINVKGRKRFTGRPYCPVRNLVIADNVVKNAAIVVLGEPTGRNVVERNVSLDDRPAILVNESNCAELRNNRNFEVFASEAEAKAARRQRRQ
jgi:hypothetical protein